MARVLVVGSDIQGEHALLQRLRDASSLPAGSVRSCRDLDDCDLLVIKDTPALRNAALRMVREHPRIQFWVEDQRGELRMGQRDDAPAMDDSAIRQALWHMPASPGPLEEPSQARGAKAVTGALRSSLQSRQGHALLALRGEPLVLIDFIRDQMVMPAGGDAGALAQTLADAFEELSLHGLSARRYEQLAAEQQRLPLRPLLWQWGQLGTAWQDLDRKLQQHARVKLLRWPDFRVLAHQHDSFRLCSLLLKRACSVDECSRLLDMTGAAVREFVHPAFLCGYAALEAPSSGSWAARDAGAAGGSLLARMWRGLRRRGGE